VYLCKVHGRNPETDEEKDALRALTDKLYKFLFVTLFMVYPGVSQKVLQAFDCRLIDEVWYIKADVSLPCYDEAWVPYGILAAAGVLCYSIGIPLGAYLVLKLADRDPDGGLQSVRNVARFGFLYSAYAAHFWFGDLLMLGKKLFMGGVVMFISPGSVAQVGFALIVGGMCMVMHLVCNPMAEESDDKLETAGMIGSTLTLFSAVLLMAGACDVGDQTSEVALQLFMVGGNVAVVLSMLYIAFITGVLEPIQQCRDYAETAKLEAEKVAEKVKLANEEKEVAQAELVVGAFAGMSFTSAVPDESDEGEVTSEPTKKTMWGRYKVAKEADRRSVDAAEVAKRVDDDDVDREAVIDKDVRHQQDMSGSAAPCVHARAHASTKKCRIVADTVSSPPDSPIMGASETPSSAAESVSHKILRQAKSKKKKELNQLKADIAEQPSNPPNYTERLQSLSTGVSSAVERVRALRAAKAARGEKSVKHESGEDTRGSIASEATLDR